MGFKLLLLIKSVVAAPLVILIYFHAKARGVVYFEIISERYGNHILDGTNKIILAKESKNRNKLIFFQLHKATNAHWQKMLERQLGRIENFSMFATIIRRFTILHDVFVLSKPPLLDIHGKYYTTNIGLPKFSDEEENCCSQWTRSKKITGDAKIICLMVRDDQYLRNSEHFRNRLNEYHSYRDTNITSYERAIRYLINKNYVVVRMGKDMKTRVNICHPNFIDYAFDPEKSELLDIWLFSKATGVIGTGTGPDVFGNVCRIPVLYLNFLPLLPIHSFHDTLTHPKQLRWRDTKNKLNISDQLHHSYVRTQEYEDAGIQIDDLTSEEILRSTREFIARIEGTYRPSSKFLKMQDKFWQSLEAHEAFTKKRPWKHQNAKVTDSWLEVQDTDFFN